MVQIEAWQDEVRRRLEEAHPDWTVKAARELQDREAKAGRRINTATAVQRVVAERKARWGALKRP